MSSIFTQSAASPSGLFLTLHSQSYDNTSRNYKVVNDWGSWRVTFILPMYSSVLLKHLFTCGHMPDKSGLVNPTDNKGHRVRCERHVQTEEAESLVGHPCLASEKVPSSGC